MFVSENVERIDIADFIARATGTPPAVTRQRVSLSLSRWHCPSEERLSLNDLQLPVNPGN